MYPMTPEEFDKWIALLREHFPDHAMLADVGGSWYPGKRRRCLLNACEKMREMDTEGSSLAGVGGRGVGFDFGVVRIGFD
jgi:hypothetical protein